MHMRRLGSSGLMVSALSLGTMIFGEQSGRSTPPDHAKDILSAFADAGGNFIDTANVYAAGRSERIIGEWLAGRPRDAYVIATKVRFPQGGHPNAEGLSRSHIITEVERSLQRLATDYIDVYYAHMWDPHTPLEETLRAFDDLITAGKVRYIGVSNFTAWQAMKALAVSDAKGYARFVAAQYQYSLVERSIDHEFLDMFAAEGVGITAWGPLGGGFLSGKYSRDEEPDEGRIAETADDLEEAWHRRNTDRNWAIVDAAAEIADKHEATLPQVAINWLLTRPAVSSVILGVRTMAQLQDNLGAVGWQLGSDDIAALNAVSTPPQPYPYRMIDSYGGRANS